MVDDSVAQEALALIRDFQAAGKPVTALCTGTLVLARAEQSLEPFDLVAEQLQAQVRELSRAAARGSRTRRRT